MIRYELKCAVDHSFEGWFRDSAGFDAQKAAGELTCPVCGSGEVSKALMAPALAKSSTKDRVPVDPMTLLRALRRQVEANCENVGERFAEEARKIHYGETDARAIYGDTKPEEAEALAEEGIDFVAIPWVPATDS